MKKVQRPIKKKQISKAVLNALNNINEDELNYNQTWDELEALYKTTAQNMLSTMAGIESLISIPNIIDFVKDKETYTLAINTLTRDFDKLGDKLIYIHKLHEGKTGKIETEKDISVCFSVFGEYSVLLDEFRGLTLPTIMSITDMSIEAKILYDKSKETDQPESQPTQDIE